METLRPEYDAASLASRLAALLIDLIVILLLGSSVFVLLADFVWEISLVGRQVSSQTLFAYLLAAGLAPLPLSLFYFSFWPAVSGQTIGKLMMGIRIVSLDGERLNAGRAFLRWAGYLLGAVLFMLGFLWAVVDPNRMGWHDHLARTMVVNES